MLSPNRKANPLLSIIQIQRILLEHGLPQNQILFSEHLLNIKHHIILVIVHDQFLQVQTNRCVIKTKSQLFFIVPVLILLLCIITL